MAGVVYETKVVEFNGKQRRIVCEGTSRPCPIVALGNALLLRGEIEVGTDVVRQQQLGLFIYQFLMQRKKGLSGTEKESLVASINFLKQPLNIGINFTRVDGISCGKAHTLFEDIGIRVLHGWVVDPENVEVANFIGPDFFEVCNDQGIDVAGNLTSDAGDKIKKIFGSTGLTTQGLQLLKERKVEEEGEICLLFWSSCLHTIFMKNGSLFVLHNESGYSGAISWRELNSLRNYDTFWDGHFSPCTRRLVLPSLGAYPYKCLKKKCRLEFSSEFNLKRHKQLHRRENTVMEILNRSKVAEFWDGLAYEHSSHILSLKDMHQITDLTGPLIIRMLRSSSSKAEPHASIAEDILNIITGSVVKISSSELFDLLDACSGYTFLQNDPRKFDSGLDSRGIISNITNTLAYCAYDIEKKLVTKLLDQMEAEASTLEKDLLMKEQEEKHRLSKGDSSLKCTEHFDSKELENKIESEKEENPPEIRRNDEIVKDCLGQLANDHEQLSPSDCTSFVGFVRKRKLTKSFELRSEKLFKKLKHEFDDFNNKKLKPEIKEFKLSCNVLTFAGRRCARGYMKCIIMAHRANKSWNGLWNTSDMKVSHGSYYISKEPCFQLTADHMADDFKRYAEVLFPYYRSKENSEYPFYFNEFMEDILKVPDPIKEPDKLDLFQKYMALHCIFMPPVSRSTLLEQLYKACEALIFKPATSFGPLVSINPEEWRDYVTNIPLFKDVYYYQSQHSYNSSSWALLTFIRHFIAHVRDYTKENGIQLIEDLATINLMLTQLLGPRIPELLLDTVNTCKMDGVFFGIWRTFEASDGVVDFLKEKDEDDVSEEETGNQRDISCNVPGDNA